jgi:hypothetical protein
MRGKFFLAWVVVFVLCMVGGMLVHGMLLKPDYEQIRQLFRSETDAQAHFPWMILAHIVFSGAFVWIYSRGIEPKPWLAQGVRYGIAVAFLTSVTMYLIYYTVQPIPGATVVKQIVFDSILCVILGIVTAWVYRGRAASV